MNAIFDFFQYIVNLGVSVMMPLIITVLGLIFGNKFSASFKSGLTVGVGFVGLNVIATLMTTAISPVTKALVENYNFHLVATDIGWGVGSSLAWGTQIVPFVFITVIATNVVMILLNWTKTMDVDIWNFWHSMMIAGALYLTTKSMILALLSAVINMAIVFKIADWTQNDLDEVLGLEGISFPQIQSSGWALIGYPLNWLFDRIPGVKNISWTPEKVQSKLGIFGEPMLIGLFVGGILAAAARMPLDQILQTAVTIAASLVLMPRMVALLMDGLTLISESAQEWMQKRFEGRELYIGLDSALGIGHPYVLTTGLLMIPVALILAFILPGNKVLPLADLIALPYFMIFAIVPSKGNLFRGLITGVMFTAIILYCATYAAPIVTQLAAQVGYQLPADTEMVTSLAVGSQWYTWIIYALFKAIGGIF